MTTQPATKPATQPTKRTGPPRTSLAQHRLASLAAGRSLRQGLPDDGTPRSEAEAHRRCPHVIRRHRLLVDPMLKAPVLHSWTGAEMPPHICIGGWQL
jgi:hypothetical protein